MKVGAESDILVKRHEWLLGFRGGIRGRHNIGKCVVSECSEYGGRAMR